MLNDVKLEQHLRRQSGLTSFYVRFVQRLRIPDSQSGDSDSNSLSDIKQMVTRPRFRVSTHLPRKLRLTLTRENGITTIKRTHICFYFARSSNRSRTAAFHAANASSILARVMFLSQKSAQGFSNGKAKILLAGSCQLTKRLSSWQTTRLKAGEGNQYA